jgi:hypothetical protein
MRAASLWLFVAAACAQANSQYDAATIDGGEGTPDASRRDASRGGDDAGDDASAPTDAYQPLADSPGEDAAGPWPVCNGTIPGSAAASTIPQIWSANYATPQNVYVAGVWVTSITGSACTANAACSLYLQQDLSYADLPTGAQHAIRIMVSAAAAQFFANIAVGDKVDVMGYAYRFTNGGQNELLVDVNATTRGCVNKVGGLADGDTLAGTPAMLTDLTVDGYETTIGPLLVEVDGVSGTPSSTPTKTFKLTQGPQDAGATDGGVEAGAPDTVSVSPYDLPNSAFTGLSATHTTFTSITGVFGMYVPYASDGGVPAKYIEIYPGSMADLVQ